MADPISWIASKVGEWVAMTVFQGASAVGLSVQTAATLANIAAFASSGLVYVGAFALPGALSRPNLPDPGEGTEPTNQTRPEIQLGTGRARLSGPRLLWESIPGWNVEIIALHEGPVDGFETFYLNDDVVTLDSEGWVQPLEGGRYGEGEIRILTRKGEAGEAPFHEIIDLFADAGLSELYGEDSYAHGVAKVALLCRAVDDENVLKVYPNGPPKLSVVTRMSRVYDWRDPTQDLMDPTTWKWRENAQVNQVHFEWLLRWLPIKVGATGWIQGDGRPPPDWCLTVWNREIAPHLDALTASADVCDQAVDLKAGGQEPKYRQGGWWRSLNQAADIRRKFLDCYDGRMCETGSGAFLFSAGVYAEPDYVLSGRNMAVSAWNRGAPDREQTNVLTADFTSPAHDWSRQPSDAWRDEALISRQGEKASTIDLTWVHSHGQARRLLKRFFSRANASLHGSVDADLEGLEALERRYIRLTRRSGPQSIRDMAVEVMRARIDLMNGRVPLEVVQADPNIDSWNPATEEGQAPPTTARAPRVTAPTPVIVSVTPETAAGVVRLRIRVEDPGRPGLRLSARWRPTGDVSWDEGEPSQIPTSVDGDLEIVTVRSVDPTNLDVQAVFWSGGEAGAWSATTTTNADLPPDPVEAALAAIVAAMTTPPTPTRQGHMRTLIAALHASGVWQLLGALWLIAAHDSQAGRVNWITPVSVLTVQGAPAFTVNKGYQGDGVDDWLDAGVGLSGLGGYALNDATMFSWALTDADLASVGDIGTSAGTTSSILSRSGGSFFAGTNSSLVNFGTVSSSTGLSAWSRTGSTAVAAYRDGVQFATTSTSSSSISSGNLGIMRRNAFYSSRQIAAAGVGRALTQAQHAALFDALEDYLAAIGAV